MRAALLLLSILVLAGCGREMTARDRDNADKYCASFGSKAIPLSISIDSSVTRGFGCQKPGESARTVVPENALTNPNGSSK